MECPEYDTRAPVAQALLPVHAAGVTLLPVHAAEAHFLPVPVCVSLVATSAMTYYERNLPHWQPEGRPIFLTWRLYGSLPRNFVKHLEKLHADPGRQFLAVDQRLDCAATGPRWLSDPEIAGYAEYPVIRGAELQHYVLHAYVVMPNHVHVLLDPLVPLRRITAGIKGVSARDANGALGRTGRPFWQDESFDHWIRNPAEFERVQTYIVQNPVKAGLAMRPEDWIWSSAHK